MNLFQRLVIQALLLLSRQIRHVEQKLAHLSEHLGAELPPELIKTGTDLQNKTAALEAALNAQAQQPTEKEIADAKSSTTTSN